MGLFDFWSGGAQGDLDKGYGGASAAMMPYQQGGAMDYQKLRQFLSSRLGQGGAGGLTGGYANPWDSRWKKANEDPQQMYGEIMNGYTESPDAKYQRDQAMNGYNNAAAASGMIGSGDHFKFAQQNANDVAQRDRQHYFDNIMNTDKRQMDYADSFSNQYNHDQDQTSQLMQFLASMGFNGASGNAQNSINQGQNNAGQSRQNMQDWTSILSGLGGLFL
jgi:hypothetical protein